MYSYQWETPRISLPYVNKLIDLSYIHLAGQFISLDGSSVFAVNQL